MQVCSGTDSGSAVSHRLAPLLSAESFFPSVICLFFFIWTLNVLKSSRCSDIYKCRRSICHVYCGPGRKKRVVEQLILRKGGWRMKLKSDEAS